MNQTNPARALIVPARRPGAVLAIPLLSIPLLGVPFLSGAGCGVGGADGQGGSADQQDVGGEVQNVRTCVLPCATATDCAPPDAPPPLDASHFTCTNEICQYIGCKDDQECTAQSGEGWACHTMPGLPLAMCVLTCSTTADCTLPELPPVYDASHFACMEGVCAYTGCKTDQECAASHGEGSACRTTPGSSFATCVLTCTAAADCAPPDAHPSLDASHFACTNGVCEHLGCKNDQECVTSLGEGAVCM